MSRLFLLGYHRRVKRLPVTTFFVLAFLVTWVVWVPRAMGADWAVQIGQIWAYGPAIAALLAAALTGGRPTFRQLVSGLDKWRLGWTWYAVIVIGPLGLALVTAAVNLALGGSWKEGLPDALSEPLPIILLLIFILTITDGLGEELGWRGFALPRMLEQGNAFRASFVLGLIWALWHAPLLWTEGNALEGSHLWLLIVRLPATSVIFTWVFRHTAGSIVAASLLHGALNVFSVAPPTSGEPLTPALITMALHWLVALGLVVYAGHRRLDGLPREQSSTQSPLGLQ